MYITRKFFKIIVLLVIHTFHRPFIPVLFGEMETQCNSVHYSLKHHGLLWQLDFFPYYYPGLPSASSQRLGWDFWRVVYGYMQTAVEINTTTVKARQCIYLRGAPSAISMAVIPKDHKSL